MELGFLVNHFDEVTKLESNVINNLIFRQNSLDKVINQIPENIDLQNLEHPFEFILNKTEFKKIEHLLDKDHKYKNFKVNILDKTPDDLIYLRQKQSSKYF